MRNQKDARQDAGHEGAANLPQIENEKTEVAMNMPDSSLPPEDTKPDGVKNDGTELTVPSAEGDPVDKLSPTAGNNSQNVEDVTPKKCDIFDDLAALGCPPEELMPSEKVLTSLPVRKPKPDEWVRAHPEMIARVYAYHKREENSWYVVLPAVVEPLRDLVRSVQLTLAVNRAGSAFLWPVPVPGERNPHRAHVTAFGGAEQAMNTWVRVSWNTDEYEVYRRPSAGAEPAWPTEITSASEMLRFASKNGGFEVIDSVDHPVVRDLLGID